MPDEPLPSSPEPPPGKTGSVPVAWQPFTPRGVAAFATTTFARLFLLELVVALLATVAVVWFLSTVWFPVVREAILQLPATGAMEYGEMKWPGPAFQVLQERRPFIAFLVDLDNQTKGHSGVDVSLRFHRRQLEIFGPLGSLVFPYPREYRVEFNRPELEPWWGAWQPILLGWTAVLVPLWLLIVWAVLATLYFAPAWLLAFFANRQLTWGGSWRLASASLMPGAVLYTLSIVLYGLGVLDLFHLLLASVLHIVLGWLFVLSSVLQLPRVPEVLPSSLNPFGTPGQPAEHPDNPFAPKSAAASDDQPKGAQPDINHPSGGKENDTGGSVP